VLIYEPSGKAREYSPLALNIYSGCDHRCTYCYVPMIRRGVDPATVTRRKNFLETLDKELTKNTPLDQVLLSFMCDPYCHADVELQETRKSLTVLAKHRATVAVLTKGGSRCLRDLDLFRSMGKCIKIGATLTFQNERQSLEVEPGAASPSDRLSALEMVHKAGIKTFVSIEPVVDPAQSLGLIRNSLGFVDQYKVGKMNHFEKRFSSGVDWTVFLYSAVDMLRSHGKKFYIKEDLRAFDRDHILTKEESDYSTLFLKSEKRDTPSSDSVALSLF